MRRTWELVSPLIWIVVGLWVYAAVAGCVSPYKVPSKELDKLGLAPIEGKAKFVVSKDSEKRQPFGTNGGQDFTELCDGPEKKVLFYFEDDFTDCELLQPEHPLRAAAEHKTSKGAGPDLLMGAAVAGTGGAIAAGVGANVAVSAAANASSKAVAAPKVVVPRGKR